MIDHSEHFLSDAHLVDLDQDGDQDLVLLGLYPGLKKAAPLHLVINDEKDEPIGGEKRLEWIKGTFSGVDSSVKSGFYLVMFIILLIGALIGFYVFIFKKLGIFLGGPGIIRRNKSAT